MHPIDLHTHSSRSDGTYAPGDLVRYAYKKGLSAIALTDHDTVDGIDEALRAARELQSKEQDPLLGSAAQDALPVPEVIPGVELSTEYNGRDIHIVGLFVDWRNPEFTGKLRAFADARIYRNQKMCRLLTDGGYPVTMEALEEEYPDTVITRAHFGDHARPFRPVPAGPENDLVH